MFLTTMENSKMLKDKDILALYRYLIEYEKCLKEQQGLFDIYNQSIINFRNEHQLFLGSINRKKDKERAEKYKNYILWKEGSLTKKNSVDRAHALLRRIRNAFAHVNLLDDQSGCFKLKDIEDNQKMTLDSVISYSLLYQFIEELKKTNNKY